MKKQEDQEVGGVSVYVDSGASFPIRDVIGGSQTTHNNLDVSLFAANFSSAFQFLRKMLPQDGEKALERLKTVLRQLRLQQRRVNELKKVHNMLHRLETTLDTIKVDDIPSFRHVRNTWRKSAQPRLLELAYFSEKEMQYLDEPRFIEVDAHRTGPHWITELWKLKEEMEVNLKTKDLEALGGTWDELLDSCRLQLLLVDSRLLEAITLLDHYTEVIVNTLSYDE